MHSDCASRAENRVRTVAAAQVTVDDAKRQMQILERHRNLCNVGDRSVLFEVAHILEQRVQISRVDELHDKVQVGTGLERVEELHHEGALRQRENFSLCLNPVHLVLTPHVLWGQDQSHLLLSAETTYRGSLTCLRTTLIAYRSRVVFLAASTTCPYAPREMGFRISKELMLICLADSGFETTSLEGGRSK